MKIVFLTSSINPGRDAVGDYTLNLANAVVSLGHECHIIGYNLNSAPDNNSDILCQEAGVSIIQLAGNLKLAERGKQLLSEIENYSPDWVSIQFVPFGFDKKGIPDFFKKTFSPIANKISVQMMFHEIWLGEKPGLPFKQKILGYLQKKSILSLLNNINPKVIQTSNPVYQSVLKREGWNTKLLNMISNFPVLETPNFNTAWTWTKNRQNYFVFGFLGSIYKEWDYRPFIDALIKIQEFYNKKVALVSVGSMGAGKKAWDLMANDVSEKFLVYSAGIQSKENISSFLQSVDFGVALTPISIIGKSGSAAAMLEHGLPIIALRDNLESEIDITDQIYSDQIYKFQSHLDEQFLKDIVTLKKRIPRSRLNEIAVQFISDLN